MNLDLPWGQGRLGLRLPDSWKVLQPEPEAPFEPGVEDDLEPVRRALAQPAQSSTLADLARTAKNILIVIDDNTRPTPTHRFLHLVIDELEKAGASLARAILMPALGIHTPMSQAEMEKKAGAHNLKRLRWQNHDAFDTSLMHDFGATSRGTPVELHAALADADLVVLVGLIEPHLWAGFGGGLKNVLPGLASARCIGKHHSIIAEPPYLFNRVGMDPGDNDFRLDLEEILGLIRARFFCLNVSIDHAGRIMGAFAGHPVAAHRQGIEFNKRLSGLDLDRRVDGIIVNAHPMDMNFKQSMKCVGNSLPALKPGGVIMGFLRAERGMDDLPLPPDPKPLWLVRRILRLLGPKRIMGFLEKTKPGLNVEEKFLVYYSMQLIRQYELYFHAPTLNELEVKHLGFFRNFQSPQAVIDQGARKLGRGATVAVFPRGGVTFPVVG